MYRSVLRADPNYAEAHYGLSSLLTELRRHDDASREVKRAIKLAPGVGRYHAALGNVHFAVKDFERARAAYQQAARLEPNSGEHRFNLALALDRLGDREGAERELREGVRRAPSHVPCHVNLGQLLSDTGRFHDAIEVLEKATAMSPNSIHAWISLGNALRFSEQGERAVAAYRRAVQLAPGHAQVLMNLGQMLREIGHTEEAVATLRQAVAAAPDLVSARLALAQATRHARSDEEFEVIENLAKQPEAHGVRAADVLFAHSKVLDDVGDHDGAFAQMLAANAARRATFSYSIDDERTRFDRIRAVFDAQRVASFTGLGHPDATPVFVIGMPRSGTTLVEQILASHPDVEGAGETDHLATVLAAKTLPGGHPEAFVAADAEAVRAAGAGYVERLRRGRSEVRFIVDKQPTNFVFAGAIRAILPNAHIVHCVRDARDTCLSVLRQNFEHDLRFAFDQVEVARYHLLYEQLMAHWHAVLGPGAVLDVRYEDLVTDLEGGARRMLDHLGLPWDPTVLEFHRTARTVRTASLEQVRRPVYTASIGQWRRWQERLRPMLDVLDALAV